MRRLLQQPGGTQVDGPPRRAASSGRGCTGRGWQSPPAAPRRPSNRARVRADSALSTARRTTA